MKDGPDFTQIAALIGDPARANMLTALMSGMALTATELAQEAGITAQTASGHLSKLEAGGLLRQRKQGRHRYFSLADHDVGLVLEGLMGLAAKNGFLRTRTGPKDPELRQARVCHDHLAGALGVQMLDYATAQGFLIETEDALDITQAGTDFYQSVGIDFQPLQKSKRPLCKSCLDWSMRRTHLAGGLGKAVLDHVFETGWASRPAGSRIVAFTKSGEAAFINTFCPGG